MKIAKRFMTLALATALGVGCATVGVSAAGSRTNAITVSDEQSAIYEIVQKLVLIRGQLLLEKLLRQSNCHRKGRAIVQKHDLPVSLIFRN